MKSSISDWGKSVCGVQVGHSPVPPSDGIQKHLDLGLIGLRFPQETEIENRDIVLVLV